MAYQAFISYSHAADDALAPALQQGLQTLARPWNRRRALEVFRDQTGLAVSPGLWSSIQSALDQSEHFVLLASPEAAASPWVDREIKHWLTGHSLDRLLPVLTGGDWAWDPVRGDFDPDRSTAVPLSLMGVFSEEPRHLDLRWARTETELDLRNSRFRDAVAQLAAPMHAMTPEDLESADVTHYRRLVRLRRAVVTALSVLLILVSVAGVMAVQSSREARHQQDAADANALQAEKNAKQSLALQLVAQAEVLADEQKTLSLLLSLEASRLDPTESWGSLVDGIAAAPGLAKIIDLPTGLDAGDPAAIDRTGTVLASAARSGDIRLLRLSVSGGRPRVLQRPDGLYPKVAEDLVFGPGPLLAARYVCPEGQPCTRERRVPKIAVWDTETRHGRELPSSGSFDSPVFDASGKTLAAFSVGGLIRVWDVPSRTVRKTFPLPSGEQPTAIALSPDGETLAVGDMTSGLIRLFRLDRAARSAERAIRLRGADYPVQLLLGSRDALVSRTGRGRVTVWDPRTGVLRSTPDPIGRTIDLAMGRNRDLVTADEEGLLRLWDLRTLRQDGSALPSGSKGGSTVHVTFAEHGLVVSVSSTIRFWDRDAWGETGETIYENHAPVTALAMSRSGQLVSGDNRGVVTLSSGDGQQHLDTGQRAVTALAVSDSDLLATGGGDGTVRLWDAESGQPQGMLRAGRHEIVTSMAFREDGGILAVGYKTARPESTIGQPIRLWDVSERRVVKQLPAGLAQDVQVVAFSSDGLLASGGSDYLNVVEMPADLSSESSTVLVQSARARLTALAFSPDGAALAAAGHHSADRENRVSLWDPTKTRDQVAIGLVSARSPGWDGTFAALSYAPNGHLLAGAGSGGVQLWDIEALKPIGGLLTSSVSSSVVIDPDGRQIVVGDADGRVETYPATLAGWQSLACDAVNRNLSLDEWAEYVGPQIPYEAVCSAYPSP